MSNFSTKAIHTHYKPNKEDGAIIPPLHLSVTFEYGNDGEYDYSRTINPTRQLLEATIAALDGNKYGLAYSSGSAALANIVSMLKPEEEIMFSADAYGGTYRFIVKIAGEQGIKHRIANFSDLKDVEDKLKEGNVKIVWMETPTNPLLNVADIEEIAKLAHKQGAILVVDNTFATPILQQPAKIGADIIAYSTTKYMNGHSDSIGGALTLSNKELYDKLKFAQNAIGAILSPFDAWLTLRGLRTLELRMQRHVDNAEKIADFLSTHKKIKKVFYPGLFKDEQGKIVKKQMTRPGAMISIELADGVNVNEFIKALKYFPLAESLGGVESLLDHPVTMTHGSIPKEEREKIGLSDSLLRLSIGIENVEDLIDDLKNALEQKSVF